jgi:hypothetical protein
MQTYQPNGLVELLIQEEPSSLLVQPLLPHSSIHIMYWPIS